MRSICEDAAIGGDERHLGQAEVGHQSRDGLAQNGCDLRFTVRATPTCGDTGCDVVRGLRAGRLRRDAEHRDDGALFCGRVELQQIGPREEVRHEPVTIVRDRLEERIVLDHVLLHIAPSTFKDVFFAMHAEVLIEACPAITVEQVRRVVGRNRIRTTRCNRLAVEHGANVQHVSHRRDVIDLHRCVHIFRPHFVRLRIAVSARVRRIHQHVRIVDDVHVVTRTSGGVLHLVAHAHHRVHIELHAWINCARMSHHARMVRETEHHDVHHTAREHAAFDFHHEAQAPFVPAHARDLDLSFRVGRRSNHLTCDTGQLRTRKACRARQSFREHVQGGTLQLRLIRPGELVVVTACLGKHETFDMDTTGGLCVVKHLEAP